MNKLHHDSNWPRAGAWLRGELETGTLGHLSMMGVPACRGSITPGRCDQAPEAIRNALDRFSTFDIDQHANLLDLAIRDLNDLDIANLSPEDALDPVRKGMAEALEGSDAVILLGGDNSITFPAVEGLGDCGLITFDAHLDLRSLEGGLTNGNPVRALLDKGFPGDRIVQIGIQSFANSKAYFDLASDAGIRIFTADQVRADGIASIVHDALQTFDSGAVYVDVDLDVLDRAYAPAASGSRTGGLTPSDLRTGVRLCGEFARVRVLDLVEVDPSHDVADQTSLAAAACLLSFASGVHRRCSRSSVVPRS